MSFSPPSQLTNETVTAFCRDIIIKFELNEIGDSDLIKLFQIFIDFLSHSFDDFTIEEVNSSIFQCWKYNPRLILNNLNFLFEKSKSSPEFIIASTGLISTHIDNIILPDQFSNFIDECYEELNCNISQLENEDCDEFLIFDNLMNRKQINQFLLYFLCSFPFVQKYANIFITYALSHFSSKLLYQLFDVYISNQQIDIIQRKPYESLPFIEFCSTKNLISLLQLSNNNEFDLLYKEIYNRIYKDHKSKLAYELLKRMSTLDHEIEFFKKSEPKHLEKYSRIQIVIDKAFKIVFSKEILLHLKKYTIDGKYCFRLPIETSKQFPSFPDDQEFLVLVSFNPFIYVNQDVLNKVLLETSNVQIYNHIVHFKEYMTSPIYESFEFWLHLIPLLRNKKQYAYSHIFYTKFSDKIIDQITDILLFNFPQNMTNDFFIFFSCVFANNYIGHTFTLSTQLLNILKKIESFVPIKFWELFTDSKPIVSLIPNPDCNLYLIFGAFFHKVCIHPKDIFPKYKYFSILDQTPESLKEIAEFLNSDFSLFQCGSLSREALSFVTASLIFLNELSSTPSHCKNENLEMTKIVNLSKDLVIPFITLVIHISTQESVLDTSFIKIISPILSIFSTIDKNITDVLSSISDENHQLLFAKAFFNTLSKITPNEPGLSKFLPLILSSLQNNDIIIQKNLKLLSSTLSNFFSKILFSTKLNKETKDILNSLTSQICKIIFDHICLYSSKYLNDKAYINFIKDQFKRNGITSSLIDFIVSNQIISSQNNSLPRQFCTLFKEINLDSCALLAVAHDLIQNNEFDSITNIIELAMQLKCERDIIPLLNQNIPVQYKLFLLKNLNKSMCDLIDLEDIKKILNSVEKAEDLSVFYFFFTSCFSDRQTALNYFILYFEKYQNDMIVPKLNSPFPEYNNEYKVAFRKCFQIWNGDSKKKLILQKPEKGSYEKNSDFSTNFVVFFFNEIKTNPTWQVFAMLSFVATHFLFIFTDYEEIQSIFEQIFNIVKIIENYSELNHNELNHENNDQKNQIRTALFAIYFLGILISSTKYADKFFTWGFSNFENFNDSQSLLFLLMIEKFINQETSQHVIISYMFKYNWIQKICLLISRNQTSSQFHTDLLKRYLITTSNKYLVYLNIMSPSMATTLDELTKYENPFDVAFDHILKINPFVDVGTIIENYISLSNDDKNFLNANIKGIKTIPSIFINCSKNILVSDFYEPLDTPDFSGVIGINPNVFNYLSDQDQALTLKHSLQLPQKLNPAMERYLVSKPSWIYAYLKQKNSPLLTPMHYVYIHRVVNELNQLANHNDISDNDFCVPVYQNHDIYNTATSMLLNRNIDREILKCLQKFFVNLVSEKETPLTLLLQEFNEHIYSLDYFGIHTLVTLLNQIKENSKNNGFKQKFTEILSKNLLKILSTTFIRKNFYILKAAVELFDIDKNFPIEMLQIYQFLLNSNSFTCLQTGLKKISQLSDDFKLKLNQKILSKLSILMGKMEFDDYTHINKMKILSSILSRFPEIAKEKSDELLKVLKNQLELCSKNPPDICDRYIVMKLIGNLIDVLCPKRDDSSNVFIDSQIDNQSSMIIPPLIFQKAPNFWSIISEYLQWFQNEINNNTALLSKHFHFLTNYYELLTFNQKSIYFHKQQNKKINHQILQLNIRRNQILRDSFNSLNPNKPKKEILSSYRVRFVNEPGADLGGLKKDWFTSLVKELFNPNYALFKPSKNGRSYQPNPSSSINSNHIEYFTFAGLIIARAIIEGIFIDAHLTTSFIKQVLGRPLSLRDLEDLDSSLYKSLQWLLDNHIDSSLEQHFSITVDDENIGVLSTIELKENGSNIIVTDENKEEFVKLMCEYRMKVQIKQQIDAFLTGFYGLIPKNEIQMFTPNELDLLICGVPEIDFKDLRENCDFQPPYHSKHHVINMFFDVISKWNHEGLAKLLLFITGSSQVPVGGFKMLKEARQQIIIAPGGDNERLPQAHTCMNTLDLPEYKNPEEMDRKLKLAIYECNTFGFA